MRRESASAGGRVAQFAPALEVAVKRCAPVFVVAATVAVTVVGCSGHRAETASTTTPAAADTWRALTPTAPAPASTSPAQPQQNWPQVGDEARDGDLAFVVTRVTGSNTAVAPDDPDNPYLKTHSQNLYMMVYLQVKNVGRAPQTFYAANQKLRTSDREFAADEQAAINSGAYRININPGNTADTVLAFDCPPDLATRTDTGFNFKIKFIELRSSDTSRGVIVSLKTKGQ